MTGLQSAYRSDGRRTAINGKAPAPSLEPGGKILTEIHLSALSNKHYQVGYVEFWYHARPAVSNSGRRCCDQILVRNGGHFLSLKRKTAQPVPPQGLWE